MGGILLIEVHLSGVSLLKGYTSGQLTKIKEDLTFPNPDFVSAKKHSRFGTGNIPPYVYYYKIGKHGAIVPRGYNIPFPHKVVSDERTVNNVDYPNLLIKLRDTQQEVVDAFLNKFKEGKRENGVIILPTGKGKSILGIYLARKTSQKALIIVNKDDLVTGWINDAKITLGLRNKEVGLIKGKQFYLGKQLTVTTIQTLSKLPPDKISLLYKEFGMIIVDEFHRSVANIYKVTEYFPSQFKIGLTATALRNDGLQDVLYLLFGNPIYVYEDNAGDKDILPVNVIVKNAPTEFNPPRETRYNKRRKCFETVPIPISDIRKAISGDVRFNTMLTNDVVHEYKQGKSCIVFTHEKEHCRVIRDKLIRKGLPTEQIQLYYGDAKTSKEEMKRLAENKEVMITVATYSIATEGTNVKAWERAFLASTVGNAKDTIQSIGRIRRTKKGKMDCLVYDYRFPYVVSAKNHGLVRDKVYYENDYTVLRRDKGKAKMNAKSKRGFISLRELRN